MDDEEEEEEGGDTSDGPVAQHTPSLNKQPPASALKKSPSDGGVSSTFDVCELKYLLQYRLYDCQYVYCKCQKWKAYRYKAFLAVYGTSHSHWVTVHCLSSASFPESSKVFLIIVPVHVCDRRWERILHGNELWMDSMMISVYRLHIFSVTSFPQTKPKKTPAFRDR